MTNKTEGRVKYAAPILLTMLLTACGSSGDIRQAPRYAAISGSDSYRVTCMENSGREIYVRYNALDTFFHPDGSEKTREEFCRENSPGGFDR